MRLTTILLVLAMPVVAFAQNFPADGAYTALRCDNSVMVDAVADNSAYLDGLDVVGDGSSPAGYHAADANHLFLRMRLEDDPAPGGTPIASSWGFEFDTDGDRTDYEVLILADGIGTSFDVTLFRNNSTAQPNDPNDPAESQIAVYTFAANARSTAASSSSFGGSGDFFLSVAVPWSDLTPIGVNHNTGVYLWVASSNSPNSLNGDFACHNATTDGPVTLVDDGSDRTSPDPATPPDGNGSGGGEGRLEGGAGCAVAGSGSLWLLLVLVPFFRRKARRS